MFWWEWQEDWAQLAECLHSVSPPGILRVVRLPWEQEFQENEGEDAWLLVNWPQNPCTFISTAFCWLWASSKTSPVEEEKNQTPPPDRIVARSHCRNTCGTGESAAAIVGNHSAQQYCQCWKEGQTLNQYSKNGWMRDSRGRKKVEHSPCPLGFFNSVLTSC